MSLTDTTPHTNDHPRHHGSETTAVSEYPHEEPRPYTVASLALEERIQAARAYLARPQAWMRLSRNAGGKPPAVSLKAVKQVTVTNLIGYYSLPPMLAIELLWEHPSPDPEVIDQSWMDRLEARFGENTFITDEEFDAMARRAVEEIPSLGLPDQGDQTRQVNLGILREFLRLLEPSSPESAMTLGELRALFEDIFEQSSGDALEGELLALIRQTILQRQTNMAIRLNPEDGQIRVEGLSESSILAAKDLWEHLPYGLSRWRMKQSQQRTEN